MAKVKMWALTITITAVTLAPIIGLRPNIKALDFNSSTNWATPAQMTLQKISSQSGPQNEPNYYENLDCSLMQYRLAGTSTIRTGCFSDTAYGMMDADNYVVVFNGTDEGLPITPYSDRDMLVPWKGSMALLQMIATPTEGSYLAMYKNPLGVMSDKRNLIGQITGKQMVSFPETLLTDSAGKRLVVNPETISFSNYGSWMVAESSYGSFIRVNQVTGSVLAFAPSFSSLGGGGGNMRSQVAVSDDGKYVVTANNVDQSFKVYDLDTCSSTVMETHSGFCKGYDYKPFIKSKISNISAIKHVRFINSKLISFEVMSTNSNSAGTYELAPEASIKNYIDYLALGDSYTSGEGAFDYLAGTDSVSNHCHLSAKSYPLLLRKDLFSVDGAHSVSCSGARINDVGSTDTDYVGQIDNGLSYSNLQKSDPALLNSVRSNFLPGYIAQNRFVSEYQPRVVTVSIGGNDVGFGDILETCAMPHASRHQSSNICYNTYEDRLEMINLVDKTAKSWNRLFKQIKSQSPNSTIYAIGYPIMVYDQGSCGLNVHLNKSEIEFINEMVVYINNTIASSASSAGVEYVDIENALYGHRLCEADANNIAMNGITAGKDSGVLGLRFYGSESYHPNRRGHELIEQAILEQTKNFQLAVKKSSTNNTTKLLSAPKSGRTILSKKPSKITPRVAKKGSKISIKVKGASTGLKPKTKYKVTIGGHTGKQLGDLTTDDKGDIDGQITIPEDTESGGSSLDIIGDGEGNEPIDINQPIYVPDSDKDSDGDGITDEQDSCPGIINSTTDKDKDGIDDACDSSINSTSESGSTGGTTGESSEQSNTKPGDTQQNSTPSSTPSNEGAPSATVKTNTFTVLSSNNVNAPSSKKSMAKNSRKVGNQNVKSASTNIVRRQANDTVKNLQIPKTQSQLLIAWWQVALYILIVWIISYSLVSKYQNQHHAVQYFALNKKPNAKL